MIPERGFMLSFEAGADDGRRQLEAYLASDAFRAARDAEPEDGPRAPEATMEPRSNPDDGVGAAAGSEAAAAAEARARPAELEPGAVPADRTAKPGVGRDADSRDLDPAALDDEAAAPAPPPNAERPAEARERIDAPGPGVDYAIYAVKFEQVSPYLEVASAFDRTRRLEVPLAEPRLEPEDVVLLRLTLPGRNQFEMWARIDGKDDHAVRVRVAPDDEQYRKAVLYVQSASARNRRRRESDEAAIPPKAMRLEATMPEEPRDRMPLRRRLQRMGMDEKINMALSGNRQERMALATDSNKMIHHYLLKNAKITVDEIAVMARLPSLNPDVLEKIAENPQYTQNPSVAKALVYNPKTPVRTAIRILDRMPRNEVALLAKRTNLNARLVKAAKKKIGDPV